jgi:hypothetical protein
MEENHRWGKLHATQHRLVALGEVQVVYLEERRHGRGRETTGAGRVLPISGGHWELNAVARLGAQLRSAGIYRDSLGWPTTW